MKMAKEQKPVDQLTAAELRAEAAKIVAQRNSQKERMKARGKALRAYQKEILAVAAAKNLLPKAS
jgi:hypothetical protein